MTRLIDANALKEYIDCGHLRNPCEVCFSELDVVNLIDEQPTIDAVPIEFVMENFNLEFVCDALTDDDEWCSKRCKYSEPPSECIHRYIDRIWRKEHAETH